MSFFITLTTIFNPTTSVVRLATQSAKYNARLVVAGDAKGPDEFDSRLADESSAQIDFLSLYAQQNGRFTLGRALPINHYARKNIAYLHAICNGATCIYETDDDNAPLESWRKREEDTEIGRLVVPDDSKSGRWINVYRYFSEENVWPRGLPLDEINGDLPLTNIHTESIRSPIQQGLANRVPDVDAVWRLTQDREIFFDDVSSVLLSPGNWSPFNTQSTWWWLVAFPLLYIPSYCTFRMCDIWKSFVAQRCLWELGYGIVFHSAEVEQDRNIHNLVHDFEEEIPGYLRNREICNILFDLPLKSETDAVSANLRSCYQALVDAKIFPHEELRLVDLWLDDLEHC